MYPRTHHATKNPMSWEVGLLLTKTETFGAAFRFQHRYLLEPLGASWEARPSQGPKIGFGYTSELL